MKPPGILLSMTLSVIVSLALPLHAQTDPTFTAGMKDLANAFVSKSRTGATAEADYAEAFARLDAFLEANAADPDAVAEILSFKAIVYAEILSEFDQAIAVVEEIARDYPMSKPAANAEELIAYFNQQKVISAMERQLVVGAVFPDFAVEDINGEPLVLADFRGQVVLLDFWATWCMPCLQELPNLKAAYERHHDDGFEIIGISLDQNQGMLLKFLNREDMTWPQYFDGKGWNNELSTKYGISSIPATFLLDREGRIVARDLRGPDLDGAVAAALSP